jgi:hypothetical protein
MTPSTCHHGICLPTTVAKSFGILVVNSSSHRPEPGALPPPVTSDPKIDHDPKHRRPRQPILRHGPHFLLRTLISGSQPLPGFTLQSPAFCTGAAPVLLLLVHEPALASPHGSHRDGGARGCTAQSCLHQGINGRTSGVVGTCTASRHV